MDYVVTIDDRVMCPNTYLGTQIRGTAGNRFGIRVSVRVATKTYPEGLIFSRTKTGAP